MKKIILLIFLIMIIIVLICLSGHPITNKLLKELNIDYTITGKIEIPDTLITEESFFTEEKIYAPKSNIGIIFNRFSIRITYIMKKYNTGICILIDENQKVLGISNRYLSNLDILILGTSGLKSFQKDNFKNAIEAWIRSGGKLIILSPESSTDYNYLPFGITGCGWDDEVFHSNKKVIIEKKHPIISGQIKKTPLMFTDGYIDEDCSSNGNVIIRRDETNNPVAVEFEYGDGLIIITSNYVDWAYWDKRVYKSDLVFLRDMIKYTEIYDKEIIEVTKAKNVKVKIRIYNPSHYYADEIMIHIYNPNNVKQQEIAKKLHGVQSDRFYECTINVKCNEPGIYSIKYIVNSPSWKPKGLILWGGIVNYGY